MKLIIVPSLLVFGLFLVITLGDSQSIQCIDGLGEANYQSWHGMYHQHAETSDDLPDPLKGKFIDGRRIIYYEGRRAVDALTTSGFNVALPAYVYVKYYAHLPNNITRGMGVFPSSDEDFKPTTNFEWAEALVHLDGNFDAGIGIQTINFFEDEYFLIEKIIYSQGVPIESIEVIKSMCPPRIDEYVECLDQVEDYDKYRWGVTEGTVIQYAQTTDTLPEPIRGNLDGDGIFYIPGDQSVSFQQIRRYTDHFMFPIYLYVKYYGYAAGLSTSMLVYPVMGEGETTLPRTQKFIWGEAVFPLSEGALDFGVRLTSSRFVAGDYFLLEKVIIAQGFRNITDMESIKELCPSAGGSTTPTPITTSEVPVTTVTSDPHPSSLPTVTDDPFTSSGTSFTAFPTSSSLSPGFACEAAGTFPSPNDCSKFYVCQYNDAGDLYETEFTCPDFTVWCQDKLRCETPVACPCELTGIYEQFI